MTVTPYERRVFYYETDNMGIVHHSNYIRWMEEARFDLVRKLGADYAEQEERGIIMPVTFASCKYLAPTHYDDLIRIVPKITLFNGIRLNFSYEIFDATANRLCCTGESGHCFLDEAKRIPVNLRKSDPEFYRRVKEYEEQQ